MEIGSIAAVGAAAFGILWKLWSRGRTLARWREGVDRMLAAHEACLNMHGEHITEAMEDIEQVAEVVSTDRK